MKAEELELIKFATKQDRTIRMNTNEFDLSEFLKWYVISTITVFIVISMWITKIYNLDFFFGIFADNFLLVVAGILTFCSVSIFALVIYYFWQLKPNVIIEPTKKEMVEVKQDKVEIKSPVKLEQIDTEEPNGEPVEITCARNSIYLQPNSVCVRKVTLNGKPIDVYKFDDLKFNLSQMPFFLVVGATGSGKTISTYNIIQKLNRQYEFPRIIIVDFGN